MNARILLVGLVAAVAVAAFPGDGMAVNFPSASCNGGGCSGGWYKSAVTVAWAFDPGGTPSGCGATTVSDDTSGATFTCTVTYPGGTVSASVTVRKDSSPPNVNGTVARDPDADGWYTKPVDVGFGGSDGASGLAGCTGGGTYGGPDGGAVTLSGTCTDNAGNSASSSLTIKYDGTPPGVTAAPSRAPDEDGWYNHPVDVAFTGTDAGSGVKECSPAVTYKGPDANPAKLVGQCRDAAGHVSQPLTVEIRYDATPPAPPRVKLVHRAKAIALTWTAGADVVRARVVRAPGSKSKQPAVVYNGKAKRFLDRKIVRGKKYWYEVTLYDQAGNLSTKTVGLKPKLAAGIVSPAKGAVLARPPLVAWSPVAKAHFYNLQLWRGKLKILTTWVRRPKLALKQRWTSQGKRYSLIDGHYELYVWPAFGTTKAPRYGKMVGHVGFVVRRH
jgi:hypothetical protein